MPEKEAMLKDVTNKAALALIGAAVLSPAFQRIRAQEQQSASGALGNARVHFMAGAAPE